ncbi:MAG: alpha/beta fold hydrolase [Planctomycetes bacterium]|nr:alpha/beta fold hydrolase [Planctomycetota bacterium]MCG2684321.1 alpha/beta fold hydrolase [Planctomycetales bacterium]
MTTHYRLFCIVLLILAALAVFAGRPAGREVDVDNPDSFPMPTLGGKQFWADELFFHQCRIQRNVLSGHCRLLDERNWRQASGTFDHCRAVLERIKRDRGLPPMTGKAVVVLHGLGRSRSSMSALCKHLQEKGGYRVFNVGYPSTQYDMAEQARTLRRLVDNLDGIEEINFVGHSMGNIVVRHYLGDLAEAEKSGFSAADRRAVARFGRFVMLAPPNQGSRLASVFANNALFKQIVGEAGQQLGRQWPELEKHLATPHFQFGVVAGGKGDGKGYNPLLSGDNDGVISVETAKLAGARDFIVVPSLHSFVMDKVQVQRYVLSFLQHGYFVSDPKRQPLEKQP